MIDDEPRYSLNELTDEAGVSVRTVRYYIAEGLLPPPVTAGPRSFYTRAHLDRLRLIDQMKTGYLPLKEIRRRLTGMEDDEVRRLAEPARLSPLPPAPPASAPARKALQEPEARSPDSATSYIARLLHRPAAAAAPAPSAPAWAEIPEEPYELARMMQRDEEEPAPEEAGATSWRRIPVGEDAELLIREDAYQRKRDRVEWLVGWARKVFG